MNVIPSTVISEQREKTHSGDSASSCSSSKWTWILALAVATICGFSASFHIRSTRFDGLTWDDSEYLTQALSTYDYLIENGFWRWPVYVARQQGGVKPVLYVNTLVGGLALFGRDRLIRAVAVIACLTAFVFAATVFFVADRWDRGRRSSLCS